MTVWACTSVTVRFSFVDAFRSTPKYQAQNGNQSPRFEPAQLIKTHDGRHRLNQSALWPSSLLRWCYMDAGISPARQIRTQHRHELRTLTYLTLDDANSGV